MKKLSFKRGVLPADGLSFKNSRNQTQERVLEHFSPKEVLIPVLQHMGTPAIPMVKAGDSVCIGQMIARPSSPMSAAVHASISGTVLTVKNWRLPNGRNCEAIHIQNDLKRRMDPAVQNRPHPETLTSKALTRLLLLSGIVGMGGEGFPTAAKCLRAARLQVKTILVNGLACEPHLTCDAHLMREHAHRVVLGALALSGIVHAQQIIFCIEDKWAAELETMALAVAQLESQYPDRQLSVLVFKSRFPQGYEGLLIKALYGIELVHPQIPEMEVGAVVFNVSTCAAFGDQLEKNLPCTSRVVTLSSNSSSPRNILVPIGTRVSELLAHVPGAGTSERIAMGGALTGVAITDTSQPILKTTQGITLIRNQSWTKTRCIQCGSCVSACPMGLEPHLLAQLITSNSPRESSTKDILIKEQIETCISCGACSYVCPSRIELASLIARSAHRLRKERSLLT